jgi:hypothetical protein
MDAGVLLVMAVGQHALIGVLAVAAAISARSATRRRCWRTASPTPSSPDARPAGLLT